jgi:ParB family chromosome partitioning protein
LKILKKEVKVERSQVNFVPVGLINPNPEQPRHQFDNESLMSLAQSIKHNGILQPLTVREMTNGDFELVAGERRLRAAILAGYKEVPCITVELDDRQSAVMSLLENLQREDLNYFDEATGIARLIEYCGLTQEQVAVKLGKSQSTIANKLRLLRIDSAQRELILKEGLTERHARALLRLEINKRDFVLKEMISKGLNVYESEKLIETMLSPRDNTNKHRSLTVIKDVRIFLNSINNAIDVMKRSGVNAIAEQKEFDNYYEYTIKIPKQINKSA